MMMEAARTSEKSVEIQLRTWQYIPEDSELHTRRRENLKSHMLTSVLLFACETWKSTKKILKDLQTFINRCLRKTFLRSFG
jgi:predicted P-loop ATPase/GTPase